MKYLGKVLLFPKARHSGQIQKATCFYFFQATGFNISCNLFPKVTRSAFNISPSFLEKIRNIFENVSAKLLLRMLSVNHDFQC